MKLLWNLDAWDEATSVELSSPRSSVAGLPPENVLTPAPAQVWRATPVAGTTYDLIFSFSAAVEIDTLAIFNIGASAATVAVAYSSDNLSYSNQNFRGYTQLYSVAGRPVPRKFLQLNTTRTAQYWRIRFANVTLLKGMFQIGRICGGVSYSPPRAWAQRPQLHLSQPGNRQQVGSFKALPEYPPYRTWPLMFQYCDQEQKDQLEDLYRTRGTTRPLVVALRERILSGTLSNNAHIDQDTIYGRIVSDFPVVPHTVNFDIGPLEFQEIVE